MRFLLDSNILSQLIRNPEGPITRRIAEVGEDQSCTSIVAAAELRFGALKGGSQRLISKVDQALDRIVVLPIEPPVDAIYAQIRARLEANGQPIGANDLLIASQAVALDLTVVTDNTREFRRVDGLRVENWLRDD